MLTQGVVTLSGRGVEPHQAGVRFFVDGIALGAARQGLDGRGVVPPDLVEARRADE